MSGENSTEKSGIIYNFLDLPYVYKLFQFLLRKLNTNQRLFGEIIDIKKESVVLDCGCGPGTYRRYIDTKNYIGIDINRKHIELAKKNYPEDKFFAEDLFNIENVSLERIDSVVMIGILHHLDDETCKKLFKNLYNTISENGVINTLDPVYIKNQRLLAKFLASKDKGNYVRDPESYLELVSKEYNINSYVIDDLLRVPYDHYFMKIYK
tara:strand:- start:533 stop:1159 length:627 start_codon:yes stop_codon:yes gene_type:complete